MTLNFIRNIAITSTIMLAFTACAKIGSPTGGKKDVTPPELVSSKPELYETNFKGKKIELNFNEYIQLTDVTKSLVISPPMKKMPTVLQRGKSIYITLDGDLKANTTYRFFFGNSVVDLNEKNPLRNFEFVFSTGDHVDTLTLRGRVISAIDHKPEKDGMYVMLYDRTEDSIPRKQLPQYIAKSNSGGWFTFTHLRPANFMIFALKDNNQNYLFDLPNETIAFSDSLVKINKSCFVPDSILKTDTISPDSVKRIPFKPQIQLYSFTENHEKQYLKKYERSSPEKLDFIFNTPLIKDLTIQPMNFSKSNWLMPDSKSKGDTLNYWISDSSIFQKDTLKLRLAYLITDSLEHLVPKYDTITMAFKRPLVSKKRQSSTSALLQPSPFILSTSVQQGGTLDLNSPIILTASSPITSIDTSKIFVYKTTNKKELPVKYTLDRDSLLSRRYYLKFKTEPKTDYRLLIDSLTFTSIYEQQNDSIGATFQTQRDDYYGSIKLDISGVKERVIIQLLNDKEELIRTKTIDRNEKLSFDLLPPAKYKFKACFDRNHNGKWDTGNFAKKQQPEKILYLDKDFSLRSNWDMTESWKLE